MCFIIIIIIITVVIVVVVVVDTNARESVTVSRPFQRWNGSNDRHKDARARAIYYPVTGSWADERPRTRCDARRCE